MSMNHDLTTRLARDHRRQMLAEASHRQRHQPRHPAPRSATRIIRGLAAAITSARVVAALAIPAAPDWRVPPDLHVIPGTTRRAVTDAGRS